MKSTYPVLAIMMIFSVLASGCVQSGGNANAGGQDTANEFQPPLSAFQPGAWSRVSLTMTSAKPVEFTYKSVEAVIGGVAYSGIETDTLSGSALVLWERGKDRFVEEAKMYSLSKFGQLTLCNSIKTEPQNLPAMADPYAKETDGVTLLGAGTYTTPTGKTVSVSKYKVDVSGTVGEYWYSNQVPFVIARSETNVTVAGKEITSKMELQDFGSGAASAFTDKDFEKCN